jgi:hypothetical protein
MKALNFLSLPFANFHWLCAIIIVIMAMDNFVMDKDMNHGGLWPMTLIMTYVLKKTQVVYNATCKGL